MGKNKGKGKVTVNRSKGNGKAKGEAPKVTKPEVDSMNKAELVALMAEKGELTKDQVTRALNALLDIVEEKLADKGQIQLVGFGTFGVREREARKGRNPQTGEEIEIEAVTIPYFKAGKGLKEAVN